MIATGERISSLNKLFILGSYNFVMHEGTIMSSKFRFKDIIITPYYCPNEYWHVPSYLGGISLPNNYGSHMRDFKIASGRIFTANYNNVITETSIWIPVLHNHFGHFIIETLSYLYNITKLPRNYPIYFSCNLNNGQYLLNFQEEMFSLYGLTNRKYVINSPTLFHDVYVSPPGMSIRGHITKEQLEVMGIYDINIDKKQKIYISRSHINKGKCVNENQLEEQLQFRGWKIIYPESMSIASFMKQLASAGTIFSLSGSALHALLLLKGKSKQKYIIYPRVHDQTYNMISKAKCDNYFLFNIPRHIVSNSADPSQISYKLDTDFICDVLSETNDFEYLEPCNQFFSKPNECHLQTFEEQAIFSENRVL